MKNIEKDPDSEEIANFMKMAIKMKLEVIPESRTRLEQKVKHLYEKGLVKKEDYDNFQSLTKNSIKKELIES